MESLNTRSIGNNPTPISVFKSFFCFFYVFYETCSFGKFCRFFHPKDDEIDRDAMRQNAIIESRKRPCKFYRNGFGFCKYGESCRYGHSEPIYVPDPWIHINTQGLPKRWDEPDCAYFMRTGDCGYGVACRFHHPDPVYYVPSYGSYADGEAVFYEANQGYGSYLGEEAVEYQNGYVGINDGWNANLFYGREPCVTLNNAGLPLRPGKRVCRFYIKFNVCGFGRWCKFHHP